MVKAEDLYHNSKTNINTHMYSPWPSFRLFMPLNGCSPFIELVYPPQLLHFATFLTTVYQFYR